MIIMSEGFIVCNYLPMQFSFYFPYSLKSYKILQDKLPWSAEIGIFNFQIPELKHLLDDLASKNSFLSSFALLIEVSH